MPSEIDIDDIALSGEEWWVARIGDMLIWARLRLYESGIARIFDCDGKTNAYDSEDSARGALLDAEYRSFDGLDEDDATELGFELDSVSPPEAADDDDLREQMFMKLPPRN
jgi:hypothetical protein